MLELLQSALLNAREPMDVTRLRKLRMWSARTELDLVGPSSRAEQKLFACRDRNAGRSTNALTHNARGRSAYDPILWREGHGVLEAFHSVAAFVDSRKRLGTGRSHCQATSDEVAFLNVSLRRLAAARGMEDFDLPDTALHSSPDEAMSMAAVAAMDIRKWQDPVRAILFAAGLHASHDAMRGRRTVEPNLNQMILDGYRNAFRTILDGYRREKACLPPDKFLHAGIASMQEKKDIAGADLALVVGTRVLGIPRYRVALVQAKHEQSGRTRQGYVGHGQGEQLAELLSSGMGFYMFYPAAVEDPSLGRETRLLPVVRSAEAVFADTAQSASPRGRYNVRIFSNRDGNVDATDFAQFLSSVMCSDVLSVGRLFPTVSSVAEALGVPDRPLAPEIVAVDVTGRLSCHELLERLRGGGYNVDEDFSFPVEDDLDIDDAPADEISPRPW